MAIDFKGMLRPIAFGKPPDDVPRPLLRAGGNRRYAALREAAAILDVLPGPGESLHAIMTGRYDLTDVVEVAFSRMGPLFRLRIATLSFNRNNVRLLKTWTEAGHVGKLTLLFSEFFRDHNPELVQELREALASEHRLAAARNHCKVCCLEFADGQKLALEGSANLRTNSNREQFCLVHDPALHDWHAAWIDDEVTKHASD